MKKEFIAKMDCYLTRPGHGVHTIHTKSDLKKQLDAKYPDFNRAQAMDGKRPVLFGIPSDSGGGILRGANWGPFELRRRLFDLVDPQLFSDLGDVKVNPHLLHDKYLNEETITACKMAMYSTSRIQLPVSPLSIAEDVARTFWQINPKGFLLGLGGDHSVSYPLVKSYLESRRPDQKAAVLHFDAHTDLLETRLGIDLCFGTWASHIIPYLSSPDLLIQLGIRSSGKVKDHWEKTFGLKQYWAHEIKNLGPLQMADIIIKHLKAKGVTELYVSFDIDALDESYAASTGTPEKEGLSPHEIMAILQELHEHFKIASADMVEVAPYLGSVRDQETTLMTAGLFLQFFIEGFHDSLSRS